jgi:hypothetical protein
LARVHPQRLSFTSEGTVRLSKRFRFEATESLLHTKKPSGLITPSGLLKLVGHAAMGVAMGLAFALVLMLVDPSGIATPVNHGGNQGIAVFAGTLVLTFGIGATLTGVVFIMTDDKE